MQERIDLDLDGREEAPHRAEGHGEPQPRVPATAASTADMMDLCMRMMLQTQQVLQKMARDKEDEKEQRRRDDEYRWGQHKTRLEMEERLENDRVEERRKKGQGSPGAVRSP